MEQSIEELEAELKARKAAAKAAEAEAKTAARQAAYGENNAPRVAFLKDRVARDIAELKIKLNKSGIEFEDVLRYWQEHDVL